MATKVFLASQVRSTAIRSSKFSALKAVLALE